MNQKKFQLLASSLLLLFAGYFFSGCAATQTWGTYQKKSTVETELKGNADLYGTIRMAKDLTVITGYSINGHSSETFGLSTDIKIEPGDIKVKSDKSGNFTCKGLKPGNYSLSFIDGNKKQKKVSFIAKPDQQLDLTLYVQSGGIYGSTYASNPGYTYRPRYYIQGSFKPTKMR